MNRTYNYVILVLSGILAAMVCVVANINGQPVSFNALAWHGDVTPGLIMLICLVIGSAFGSSLALFKAGKVVSTQKKLEEWDVQDAKLAASVKSDREKQLEAKIVTLEAALKAALKNKG